MQKALSDIWNMLMLMLQVGLVNTQMEKVVYPTYISFQLLTDLTYICCPPVTSHKAFSAGCNGLLFFPLLSLAILFDVGYFPIPKQNIR